MSVRDGRQDQPFFAAQRADNSVENPGMRAQPTARDRAADHAEEAATIAAMKPAMKRRGTSNGWIYPKTPLPGLSTGFWAELKHQRAKFGRHSPRHETRHSPRHVPRHAYRQERCHERCHELRHEQFFRGKMLSPWVSPKRSSQGDYLHGSVRPGINCRRAHQ